MSVDAGPGEAPTAIAARIGPVYSLDDLMRLLEGGRSSTGDIVSLVERWRLVGVRTTDDQWTFPAWGFEMEEGRLTIRSSVVDLWGRLPHDGFLTDVDLSARMNTRFGELGGTPVGYVTRYGIDGTVASAVSRLRNRVDTHPENEQSAYPTG